MTTVYKLTDQDGRTYGGTQWVPGEWRETSGAGDLCGPGWLHAYSDPLLALFLNPIGANFHAPRLWEAEADGAYKDAHGLKCGYTKMRVLRELPVPAITAEQRVRFGIACAWQGYATPAWRAWAQGWLDGTDRAAGAAWGATTEAWTTEAWATAWATATAWAWAADAAADAAAAAAAPLPLAALASWAMTDSNEVPA